MFNWVVCELLGDCLCEINQGLKSVGLGLGYCYRLFNEATADCISTVCVETLELWDRVSLCFFQSDSRRIVVLQLNACFAIHVRHCDPLSLIYVGF